MLLGSNLPTFSLCYYKPRLTVLISFMSAIPFIIIIKRNTKIILIFYHNIFFLDHAGRYNINRSII